MSFFGFKKKILMSCSAIQLNSTQSIGTTIADVTILDTVTINQISSEIGYPTISTTSDQITLEGGWKYFLDVRSKVSDSDPSSTENFAYWLTDTSNTQFSSTGFSAIYSDSTPNRAQEACLSYVDATSSDFVFKLRAQKTGTGTNVTFNSNLDIGTANFRAYILIKAWR